MTRIAVLAKAGYRLAERRVDLLLELGYDAKLFSLHSSAPHAPEQYRRLQSLPTLLQRATRLTRELRSYAPDITDAHGATSYGPIAALTKPPHSRLLLTLYGTDLYTHASQSSLATAAARMSLRRADLVYASSDDLKPLADQIANVNLEDRWLARPWGIPVSHQSSPDARDRVRQHHGTTSESFVAIHPRRLSEHWRIDFLIDRLSAFSAHSRRQVELWLIYPSPTPLETQILQELRERANDRGLTVRAIGPLHYDALVDHFRAADVFLCAATKEMLANSFLEAMLHGSIPVVTAVPAFTEAQRWSPNGVVTLDPYDPAPWEAALARISRADPCELQQWQKANSAAVRHNADEEETIRQLLARLG